jgi:hypothetical protein
VQILRVAWIDEEERIKLIAEPARVLAVAGHEDRHVHGAAFGDADHGGRARRDALDRLRASVDLLDVYIRGEIFRHVTLRSR